MKTGSISKLSLIGWWLWQSSATALAASAPVIEVFVASPDLVKQGEVTTLFWRAPNCTRVKVVTNTGDKIYEADGACSYFMNVVVEHDETYVLTAFGANGTSVKAKASVLTAPLPIIDSFQASSYGVDTGQSVRLEWKASNCVEAELWAGGAAPYLDNLACAGSFEVAVDQTTTFKLKAYNSSHRTAESSLTVTAKPAPPKAVIEFFYATSQQVDAGQSTSFYYKTSNATKVMLQDPRVGWFPLSAEGGVTVWPPYTSQYVLYAYGARGDLVTSAVTITVIEKNPKIDAFGADYLSIQQGQSTTLNWTTRDCAQVSISTEPNVAHYDALQPSGTLTVSPSATTTYVLNAYNSQGKTVTARLTIHVVPLPQNPVISTFTTFTASLMEGEVASLQWSVQNCKTVWVSGPGIAGGSAEMGCSNWIQVAPTYSATYTLTAYGQSGQTATATLWINVNPKPLIQYPVIEYFNTSSGYIRQGETVNLWWGARDCSYVTISGPGVGGGWAQMGCYNSITVAPQYSSNYVLTAYGSTGQTASSSVWINVEQRPWHDGFYPPWPAHHRPPRFPPRP